MTSIKRLDRSEDVDRLSDAPIKVDSLKGDTHPGLNSRAQRREHDELSAACARSAWQAMRQP